MIVIFEQRFEIVEIRLNEKVVEIFENDNEFHRCDAFDIANRVNEIFTIIECDDTCIEILKLIVVYS